MRDQHIFFKKLFLWSPCPNFRLNSTALVFVLSVSSEASRLSLRELSRARNKRPVGAASEGSNLSNRNHPPGGNNGPKRRRRRRRRHRGLRIADFHQSTRSLAATEGLVNVAHFHANLITRTANDSSAMPEIGLTARPCELPRWKSSIPRELLESTPDDYDLRPPLRLHPQEILKIRKNYIVTFENIKYNTR